MRQRNLPWLLGIPAAGFFVALCGAAPGMEIHSTAFLSGAPIPVTYGCTGNNSSPPLAWNGVPVSAKSLALIIFDPDAPGGNFVHWVLYNVPATLTHLGAAVAQSPVLVGGGQQGRNSTGNYGYFGPCPPAGAAHHYHIVLYAVDEPTTLPGATAAELQQAMQGHIVAQAELIGTFQR